MKKISLLGAVCVALFLLSWGFKGHQAVATIAENHLTPQAKAAVKELLGNQSLADVSTWADEVRNEPAYKITGNWHFLNLPLGLDHAAFVQAVKAQGDATVYGATLKARLVLQHPKTSRAQKIEALKFLVHLVGDSHQPMHISRAEDKGGNTIQVRFDNQGTNLHSLWDSKLIDHAGLSVLEMSQQYDKATPEQVKEWQKDQPIEWVWESYVISSRLYAEVEKNNDLNADYYTNHIGIVQQRIDQGGIRLAGVLNDIYSKVFSATSEAPVLTANSADEATTAKSVDLKDLAAHLNENVTVTAKVFGSKDFSSMVLVNVGAAYPNSPLTVVLRGEAKSLAGQIDGKTITVTGKVIDYKGKPEIVVNIASQLVIK